MKANSGASAESSLFLLFIKLMTHEFKAHSLFCKSKFCSLLRENQNLSSILGLNNSDESTLYFHINILSRYINLPFVFWSKCTYVISCVGDFQTSTECEHFRNRISTNIHDQQAWGHVNCIILASELGTGNHTAGFKVKSHGLFSSKLHLAEFPTDFLELLYDWSQMSYVIGMITYC